MKSKKKAFTLTELLIVVIVIGVLAAVVLPKFNKIVETRKTTEAEEIMAAVRTEQEQRCSLNKLYTNDFAKLTNALPSNETQNYIYNLSGASISATSKGALNYTLKMPSFADGRICCDTEEEGNQCANLNKDYPACNELIARADYTQAEAECTPPMSCEDGETDTQVCGCKNRGTQSRRCVNAQWTNWGECSVSECSCPVLPKRPAQTECQHSDVVLPVRDFVVCGHKTETFVCDASTNWEWISNGWDTSACEVRGTQIETKNCQTFNPVLYGTAQRSIRSTCENGTWGEPEIGPWTNSTEDPCRFWWHKSGSSGTATVAASNPPDPLVYCEEHFPYAHEQAPEPSACHTVGVEYTQRLPGSVSTDPDNPNRHYVTCNLRRYQCIQLSPTYFDQ